jgi:hypothetical protein
MFFIVWEVVPYTTRRQRVTTALHLVAAACQRAIILSPRNVFRGPATACPDGRRRPIDASRQFGTALPVML